MSAGALRPALYLLTLAATGAAAYRRAWPLAAALAAGLAAAGIRLAILPLPSPAPPFLLAIDSAMFLCWPAALAACCIATLAQLSPRPVLVAWGIAVLAAVLAPDHLGAVYLTAELAAGAASVLAAGAWALSGDPATRARVSCAALAMGHPVVVLAGAYRVDPWTRWDLHRVGYLVLLGAVLVVMLVPFRRRA